MSTLYVLCGVPASTKTTWCKQNMPKDAIYVSRDEIRFSMLKPNDQYFSKEKEVFDEFIKRIKDGLNRGFDVYADATHLNRSSRAKLIQAVGRGKWDFQALVFIASLDGCLFRNSIRGGRAYVPEDSLIQMYHRFTIPTANEGFSKIWKMEVD